MSCHLCVLDSEIALSELFKAYEEDNTFQGGERPPPPPPNSGYIDVSILSITEEAA